MGLNTLIKTADLTQNSLVLALSSIVAVEATADSTGIVAQASARAITTSLITVTLQHISTGWAFNYIKSKIKINTMYIKRYESLT